MMIWIMIVLFFVMLILGVPIAFSMGASSLFFILVEGIPLSIVSQRFFSNTQSFPFLAVPFFILMGNLMVYGGIAKRLINVADSFVRHLPGGLALVSVVSNMLMAGVSGSSTADAAGVGSILIPEMKTKGYTSSFSAAINAASSVVGIIIPPSSTMIIISWMTGLSVAKMFLAGAIPGVIISLSYFVITIFISLKRKYPRERKASFIEMINSVKNSIGVLILPIGLISSIVFGIATVTETAALAVMYIFFLSIFVFHSLDIKKIFIALRDTVNITATVMIIICASSIFTWILIREGIPDLIANTLLGLNLANWGTLTIMLIVMLIFGTFMELVPNLFILLPVFFPIAMKMGMDPVHFSMIMLISLALGMFTPPVGNTLLISTFIAKVNIENVAKDLIPYILVGIAICFLISFLPIFSLWLPNLLL